MPSEPNGGWGGGAVEDPHLFARFVLLRLSTSPAAEAFVRRSRASAGMVRRFVAGETLDTALESVRRLNADGLAATLDHLGENVLSEAEAEASAAECKRVQRRIADEALGANLSIKLTQLGLDVASAVAERLARDVVGHGRDLGQFVRIDMESSAHTDRTLDLHRKLWETHRNVGIVLQSYLLRTDADLDAAIAEGVRVRLVKGAYDEPPTVAYRSKADVDAAFLRQTKRLLEAGDYPAIATHDTALIRAAQERSARRGIAKSAYEFQMLYGIRRDLQASLARQGHPVRVYTPYGDKWFGYMMRRLAERPANLWFIVKNILRR
jgi:proline dehydrogenase